MKKIGFLCAVAAVMIVTLMTAIFPVSAETDNKKVLILICDYIGTDDIVASRTPNLQSLAQKSAIGLINNRIKNKVPASSYMSLGNANRVATVPGAEIALNTEELIPALPGFFDNPASPVKAGVLFTEFTGKKAPADAVINLYIASEIKYAATHNPMYVPGGIGSWARSQHLSVGVLGNADTRYFINRSAAILAMDENGLIPHGYVGSEILESSPGSPGGLRSKHSALLAELEKLLPKCDIIVFDLGDTSRVELSRENCADTIVARQRIQALNRNDRLIGQIIKRVDMKNTMILLLAPNANADMVLNNNFTLAPIIVYNPDGQPGYLTSPTTRRDGLVTNVDLLPTVVSYMSTEKHPGAMTVISDPNHDFNVLDDHVKLYENIRTSRNPLHYVFMLLALLMMVMGFLVHLRGNKKLADRIIIMVFTVFSMPLVFLFLGYTGYRLLPLVLIISVFIAWSIAFLTLHFTKTKQSALLFLTVITSLLITIDCFRGSPWMLTSPLGSDTIAGGRFYGIGNDYMGVLVACAVIALMLFLSKMRVRPVFKMLIGTLPLMITAYAIGSPQVGANVGGLITALVALGMFAFTITDTRLTFKRLFIIGLLAVTAVIGVAELDAAFSTNPSHAGKAVSSLFSGGYQVFLSIIVTKLGILGSTVIHSSWTIILVLTLLLYALFKVKNPELLQSLTDTSPVLAQSNRILAITALALFLVNDTGVIAAAIISVYIMGCIFIAAENKPL